MNTYTFLISMVHSKMGGQGGCVKAKDKQEARRLIIAAAEFHECELSEEHIIQLFALEDQGVMFFEECNCYGN